MECNRVTEDTYGTMESIMKVISTKEINRVQVFKSIKIMINIKGSFLMEKEMEKEN